MTDVPPGPWNIFLVDDRPENLGFVKDALAHAGHRVETFLEGRAALEKMEESPPDFVLLDLEMPGMSGIEVLGEIRKGDRYSEVIVIVLSAHPREDVEEESLAAGANEVMSKPIRLRLLREMLLSLKGMK
ncbi:MAG: response regulator [Planctomycetota bacterium]|jgi:CheY-like chemotaxis protein|nr:response regulator [Planctomycetota bacterium]